MASGGGSQPSSSTQAAPKAPDPQSEWYYEDGVLKSQRVYDKAQKGYTTNVYNTPEEQGIQKNATAFLNDAVMGAQKAFDMSPEQIASYREAYTAPQKQALNDAFNQSFGQFNTAANASGMRGSYGAQRYLAKNLAAENAKGQADIEASGKLMEFQLPRMALAPYMDVFNLATGANTSANQNQAQNLEPAFQGSQAGSNFQLNNYNNQLAQWQAMQQQNQQRTGGFLSRLFGGF